MAAAVTFGGLSIHSIAENMLVRHRMMVRGNDNGQDYGSPKTVVFKVVQQYTNKPLSRYGFGDILRGMVSTYQYCKMNGSSMMIDIHEHPISSIITINPAYNTEVSGAVHFYGEDGGSFKTLLLKSTDALIFCNVFPNPMTPDDKDFFRNVFSIKEEFKIQLHSSYSVFHIRTGDYNQRITEVPAEFNSYIHLIQRECAPGDIVCSDSNAFKQLAKGKLPHIVVYNDEVIGSHIGFETSPDILRATMVDFQLLTGASKIYTYSVYNWLSGFVDWCSKMHNIPVINLKHMERKVRVLPIINLKHKRSGVFVEPVTVASSAYSTICVAWTQRIASHRQYTWGLGDALRGTVAAYQFCKANNCKFVVDVHRHPFSHFLEWEPSELHDQVNQASIQLRGVGAPPISRPAPGTIEYIYGNAFCNEHFSEDDKRLVRKILRVRPKYKLELPASYNVIHVRVGDVHMAANNRMMLAKYIQTIAKYAKEGDYLCCDSPALKRLCAEELPHVRVVNAEGLPSHFGTDTSLEALRVTLDDMQIIMNAKKIYTYTVYQWVSNFVQWISKSFDIPLEVVNLEPPAVPVKRVPFLLSRVRRAGMRV